ncbi:SusC/RagA family TonB-linked outer membrane protein [Kaistella sp. DKR-2]|uniref:SusC/RagA family TonB-linked outer membrane protein n=1 Tax=Kaistella soli TaxID=2849654 RepID=UPI001C25E964|nr:SusC/RagA family TonB-linked outer membrane protein [Kaistella soli]MBU8883522.1 SusC/RagA family TonB-linked outer membrane protein [Kaistella soli]
MNGKLRVLSIGVLFFAGHTLMAQAKKDTATKTRDIEEVVVLGSYGIKESQEQKVGSYSLITSKVLEKPNAVSLDLAIAGQASGVVINSNSGQPGSNARVLIRGISSLSGNTQPLYIVDGVPVLTGDAAGIATTSNALAMINPADIESIEVLKDGVTTSLYGSRGAAGVIVIKTKSGKKGGKFSFNSEVGAGTEAYEKYDLLDGPGMVKLLTLGYVNQGFSQAAASDKAKSFYNWDGVTNENWQKATRNSAPSYNRNAINYSGGNEVANIYASLGYTDQQGIARDAAYNRLNATLKGTWKMSDVLTVQMSNMLSRANQKGPLDYGYFQNPILGARFINGTQPIYNPDGSYNLSLISGIGTDFNLVGIQDVNKRKSTFTKILSSLGVDYNFARNFRFSSNIGIDYNYYDEFEWQNPDFADGVNAQDPLGDGNGIKTDFSYSTWNWSNLVHYSVKLGEDDDHDINISAGAEATNRQDKNTFVIRQGYLSGHWDQNTLANAANIADGNSDYTEWHLIGYIARASYGYKNLFNVTGSFRRDGYSHFGDNIKYGNFWAAGANVNLHNFGNISNWFQNFQVRGSYGEVGNTGGDAFLYRKYNRLTPNTYLEESGNSISPGNQDLGWENSKKLNFGVDLGFSSNRYRISVDWYKNDVVNQLTSDVPNPGSTGFPTLLGNAVSSVSKGIETTLSADIFNTENFKWSLTGNYSYNDSKITKLLSPFVDRSFAKHFLVDHNPTEWYLYSYAGVDHSNGDALWYTNEAQTETTNSTSKALRMMTGKNALPTHTAGLTNNFTYKNLTLSFLFTYMGDYYVYDLWQRYFNNDGQDIQGVQVADALNSWTPDNPTSDRPKFIPGNTATRLHSTRYLYKGDHIRMKSLELGYRLPKSILGESGPKGLYVYARGVNLWTYAFDKNLPFDPEANSNTMGTIGGMGVYDQTQPNMKQYLFGITIDF